MSLSKYYNRFDPAKKYTKSLFLAGKGLQSAELNEVQEYASAAIKGIGDALFADGDVISGCTCVIDNVRNLCRIRQNLSPRPCSRRSRRSFYHSNRQVGSHWSLF